MVAQVRRSMSYANVVATMALFLALAGGAWATAAVTQGKPSGPFTSAAGPYKLAVTNTGITLSESGSGHAASLKLAGGSVTIDVTGGSVTVKADKNIAISSGGDMTTTVHGNSTTKTSGSVVNSAAGNLGDSAGGALTLTGTVADLTGTAEAQVIGTGIASISAPLTTLGGLGSSCLPVARVNDPVTVNESGGSTATGTITGGSSTVLSC